MNAYSLHLASKTGRWGGSRRAVLEEQGDTAGKGDGKKSSAERKSCLLEWGRGRGPELLTG